MAAKVIHSLGITPEDLELALVTQEAQRRNGSPVQPLSVIVGATHARRRLEPDRQQDVSSTTRQQREPSRRPEQCEFDFFKGGNVSIAFKYHDAVWERLMQTVPSPARRNLALAVLSHITRNLRWESYECSKTAAELCEIIQADKSDMARTLQLLEDVGAIQRVRRGRNKVITVTPEGAFRGNVNYHSKAVERYRLEVIDGGKAE